MGSFCSHSKISFYIVSILKVQHASGMQFKQRMSCKCCLQTHGLWFVGHADCWYTQFAVPASAKCRLWWKLCGIQLKFSSPFRSKYVGGKLCFRGVFLPYPLYPVFMCRPKLIALFILTLKLMEEVWMRAALVTYGIFRLPCAKEGHFLCSDGRHFLPTCGSPLLCRISWISNLCDKWGRSGETAFAL